MVKAEGTAVDLGGGVVASVSGWRSGGGVGGGRPPGCGRILSRNRTDSVKESMPVSYHM